MKQFDLVDACCHGDHFEVTAPTPDSGLPLVTVPMRLGAVDIYARSRFSVNATEEMNEHHALSIGTQAAHACATFLCVLPVAEGQSCPNLLGIGTVIFCVKALR